MKRHIMKKTYDVIACLIAAAFFASSNAFAYDLPMLGNHSATLIPNKKERKMGQELFLKIKQSVPVIQDPLLDEYIQTLGNRLLSNAPKQAFPFKFYFISHPAINAFTTPGGFVAMHSGTMTAVKNEAQLASVLAHEISHATQHHIVRGFEHGKVTRLATLGAVVAAVALGTQVGKDVATGALMAAQSIGAESQIGFTRAQEKEADRMGVELLYRSGYNPESMPEFFMTMTRLASLDNNIVARILSTHPMSEDRVADTENRVKQMTKKVYRHDNHRFYLMRARLIANTTQRAGDAMHLFDSELKAGKSPDPDALRYGYAIAAACAGQYKKAHTTMSELQKKHPKEIIYSLGQAELFEKQRAYNLALSVLHKQYDWYPDYKPLVLQYVQTLQLNKQPQLAINIINEYFEDHDASPELLRLKARCLADQQRTSAAYLFNAKADMQEGHYKKANYMARLGLREKGLNYLLRRKLNDVIDRSSNQ